MSHPTDFAGEIYSPECWKAPKRQYSLRANAFGQWWPTLETKADYPGSAWGSVIIRDSNPFKTFKGAIAFVEKYIAKDVASGYIFGALESGTVEEFRTAAASGQVISLLGFSNAINEERIAAKATLTITPEPDFVETPIPLQVSAIAEAEAADPDPWVAVVAEEVVDDDAIAIDDSATAIEQARSSFLKLLAPAKEIETAIESVPDPVVEPVTSVPSVPSFTTDYFKSLYQDFQAKKLETKAPKQPRQPRVSGQARSPKAGRNETVEARLFGRSYSTFVNGKLIKASAAECTAPVKIGSKMQLLILALEESPKTIEEVMEILDWQIHSARAGITDKLRKLGYGFEVIDGKYSLLMPEGETHKFY